MPSLVRTEAERIVREGQEAARELARRSFPEFLQHIVIRSDDPMDPRPIRMEPFPYQLDLGRRWQAHESTIILKRRQVGASVLLRAYALWRAWGYGWNVGYYSRGDREATEWLLGVQAMAMAMPAWMRVETERSGDLLTVGKGSIRVFPGTQRGGISFTFQCVIADEAAHHPYGRENYANYAPALGAGGQFICLSTSDPALGPSGWFYEMWTKAVAGELPYSPVFIGRWERPDQGAEWWEGEERRYVGNPQALHANYPERPEDAFVGREGLVYPMYDRERHIASAPVPWEHCLRRYASSDYGGGDPTAVPVGGVYRRTGEGYSRLHIYDALYRTKGAPNIDEIGGYLAGWHGRGTITRMAGDPAPGGAVINESIHAMTGILVERGNAARGEGLGLVAMYLERGWLTFDTSIREVVESEVLTYRWLERTDPNSKERYATARVVDNHADLLDAVRLLVMAAYADEMSNRPRTAYAEVAW